MNALVEVSKVNKSHGGPGAPKVLTDVDLRISAGKLTVLAGASGSGKTTLLTIMGGFDTADSGTITYRDPLPADVAAADFGWHQVGYLPQALALMDELTVAENVQLPVRLASSSLGLPAEVTDQERTWHWLERLGLAELADRYPSQTSGGQQQRAALARALRLQPMLLLADEPTGQLDRATVEVVVTALWEFARDGATVVITSHDPEVIAAADEVITLVDGRVQQPMTAH